MMLMAMCFGVSAIGTAWHFMACVCMEGMTQHGLVWRNRHGCRSNLDFLGQAVRIQRLALKAQVRLGGYNRDTGHRVRRRIHQYWQASCRFIL